VKPVCTTLSLLVLLAAAAMAADGPLAEPQLKTPDLTEETYGNDWNVSALGELVGDEDMYTRVWAVQALGQTHNLKALPYIQRALGDADPSVRVTAVKAAADVGRGGALDMLVGAIRGGETDMVLAALRAVADLDLTTVTADVAGMATSTDETVRAAAIKTLTALSVPADAGVLAGLIADKSLAVRLAALESALLLNTAPALGEALLAGAGPDNPPAVRSLAVEAVGKLAWSSARTQVFAAGQDADPLVRLGAVRAYIHAGQGRPAAVFLDDPSQMVRLAAIEAAGQFKQADRTERLFELLFAADEDMTRHAARTALARIGGDKVAKTAADALPRWAEMKPPPPPSTQPASRSAQKGEPPADQDRPSAERIAANTASCCWLLGELKSHEGFDYQLGMLSNADILSPVLTVQAAAIGKIGDRRAVAPLVGLLEKCRTRGAAWLTATMSGRQPPPWNPDVPCGIIRGLAAMKAADQIGAVIAMGSVTSTYGGRIDESAQATIEALAELATDDNRAAVDRFVTQVVSPDGQYTLTARFRAAKVAAAMETKSALPALQSVLTDERPGRAMMLAAAWAVQQITGQTPQVGEPRRKQDRNWVVTEIDEH
jgi:HEAT repeat protein